MTVETYFIPNLRKMSEQTLASAATTITLTGTYQQGKTYLIKCFFVGAVGDDRFSFFVNSDTTATNYYRQQLYAGAAAVVGARTNNSQLGELSNGDTTYTTIEFSILPDDRVKGMCQNTREAPAALAMEYNYFASKNAYAAGVTQILLTHNQANGFAADTKVVVYEMD